MSKSNRARTALLVSVVATALLYVVPYGQVIGYPLVLLSTIAHELGHGLAALLVGNDFHSLVVYADGSGVARHAGHAGRIGQAFVAAGGLVGPAVAAGLAFGFGRSERMAQMALGAAGIFLLLVDVLFVRNVFGFVFIGIVGLACAWIAHTRSKETAQLALVFLGVQLALSVFSRGDYLFMETAMTSAGPMPSDVAQMSQALFLPYWFWGGACGLFSVAVLAGGLWSFLRK